MNDLPEDFSEEVLKNLSSLELEHLLKAYKEGVKGNDTLLKALERHLEEKTKAALEREAQYKIQREARNVFNEVFGNLARAYVARVEINHSYYSANEDGFSSHTDDDKAFNKLLGITDFSATGTERAPSSEPFEITLKNGLLNKALGLDIIHCDGEVESNGESDISVVWGRGCYISMKEVTARNLKEEHIETLRFIQSYTEVFKETIQGYDEDALERYKKWRRGIIENGLSDVFNDYMTREDFEKKLLFAKLSGFENEIIW